MSQKRGDSKPGTVCRRENGCSQMPGDEKIAKPRCTELGGEGWRFKRIFCLSLAALLAIWLSPAAAHADSPCEHSQGDVQVWAGAVPVISIAPGLADHTYVVAQHHDGHQQRWGCFGRDNGGRILNASYAQSGNLDTYTICFMASRSPCKWPAIPLYMVVGVCHQLANRGLYTAGTIVAGANAYGLSRWFFGTYGKAIRIPFIWQYRMYNCQAQAHANIADMYSLKIVKAAYEPAKKSKEFLIFQSEYLPELKKAEAKKDEEAEYKLMNQYRRQVVSWNLDEAKVRDNAKKAVLSYYDGFVPKLEKLMEDRAQETISGQEYLKQMDALLKDVQDSLKKLLIQKQYEQFTNAPYDKTLTWEDFTDKSILDKLG